MPSGGMHNKLISMQSACMSCDTVEGEEGIRETAILPGGSHYLKAREQFQVV